MFMGNLADALTLPNIVVAPLWNGQGLAETKLRRHPHVVRGGEVMNAHSVAASYAGERLA